MFRPALAAILLCALTATPVFAKRGPPPTIKPIEDAGIQYSVPNDEGRRAYAQAWDVKVGKKIWEIDIFTTKIDPNLEEDVQWVFMASMTLQDNKLKFVDEKGRAYLLDLTTRKVEPVKP